MNKYLIMAVFLVFLTIIGCTKQPGTDREKTTGNIDIADISPSERPTATDYQTAINNLDITATKSLHLESLSGGNYLATFHILMDNKNKDGIRLIKSDLEIELHDDRGGGDHLNIGKAEFADRKPDFDLEISGTTLNNDVTLTVANIPADKIIRMINIIGDPDNRLRMTIKGDSEVALQVNRGWVTEKGKQYGVELNWHPQTQREVFMK